MSVLLFIVAITLFLISAHTLKLNKSDKDIIEAILTMISLFISFVLLFSAVSLKEASLYALIQALLVGRWGIYPWFKSMRKDKKDPDVLDNLDNL